MCLEHQSMPWKIKTMNALALLSMISVVGTLSATEELFVETPEGKQLLTGLSAHDDFLMYTEKFMGEKLRVSTSSILQQSKITFVELFSNMEMIDYILIQILHALSTKDIIFLSFLGELVAYVYRNEETMKSDWLRKNINFPSYKGYQVIKTLVTADGKDMMNIPSPLLVEILRIVDTSAALSEASEKGDAEVVKWLLKEDIGLDGYSAVEKAFLNDRTNVLTLLIAHGALDEITNQEGLTKLLNNSRKQETLLHFSAQSHRPESVAALLQAGAQPNAVDAEGYTPLHRAVESNDLEAVTLLVKNGAEVNKPILSGDTPLHLAVSKGNLSMSKLLIKLGSLLDKKNKSGLTPLEMAENTVVAAVVRYMEDIRLKMNTNESISSDENLSGDRYESPTPLSQILSEDIRDFLQQNIRQIYCHENDIPFIISLSEIVNLFLRKGEVSRLTSHLQFLLSMKAKRIEDQALSEILINLGYDTPDLNIRPILDDIDDLNAQFMALEENISFKNKTGHTHLHESAAEGNFKAAKMLIKKGADIEATTNASWTPLHFAAAGGYEDIVNLLIRNNANVNAKTTSEETPLHLTSKNGHTNVVKVLLENGANVNAENYPDCLSPLYLASKEGHLDVVEVLVKGKAHIDAKDCAEYNLTPLQVASLGSHLAVVEYLTENGADIDVRDRFGNTALYTASWNGVEQVVTTLLRLGANVRLKVGDWGLTSLHVAAGKGHAGVLQLLLSSGARLDSRDSGQATPLHWSASSGQAAVVRLLLRRGASVDATTSEGATPLHKAAANGHEEVVRLLLKSGADVDARTEDGKTPAYEAVFWNRLLALKALVENGANLYVIGPNRQTVLNFALSKGMMVVKNR